MESGSTPEPGLDAGTPSSDAAERRNHDAVGGRVRRPLAPVVENMAESAAACLVTMVQGDLFAITLGHWLIASRTGLFSGALASVALVLAREERRTIVAAILAAATFGVDLFAHPANFGGAFVEAAVTGLGAGALSLLVGKVIALRRRKTTSGRGGPTPQS